MLIFLKPGLLTVLIATLAAAPACAEIQSLRCTITPDGGRPYSGYVWLDMPNRRAFEQWYPADKRSSPHFYGPFGVSVLPNEVTISDSANPRGKVYARIDRASGSSTVSGGRMFCVASTVQPPPLPAPPKSVPPKPRPMPADVE
jgi:hypothetical protein